ncbi:MAG TPA: cation:proton antiporter [Mycobacteriales bacterium]|nr:cation:proton antiporter [Mycobacteriales bacterium]
MTVQAPAAARTARVDRLGGGRRTLVAYVLLAVVPAALTVGLLVANAGRGGGGAVPGDEGGDHRLARLLLAVAVVVAACKLAGLAVARLGQPAVIGEILAGILLGPSVLGALAPGAADALVPPSTLPQIGVLAQIGVVIYVFLAGTEVDGGLLRGNGRLALVVSHVSIAVPFLFGVLLALAAYGRLAPAGIGFLPFALFLGVSMSITALPVMARILQDLGMLRSEVGTLALTCALIGDATAWCLLALVVALVAASSVVGVLWTVLLAAVFAGLLLGVVRPVLVRLEGTGRLPRPAVAVPLALVAVFAAASTTEWIGVHAIFGAFLLGLVLPTANDTVRTVRDTFQGLTGLLLLPLFFASTGLKTEIGLLGTDPVLWLWCLAALVLAVAGKLGAALLAARAVGTGWRPALQLGVLMNCRGLTELIVLDIGLQLGVLSRELFTMLVLMALVSTAMAAPLARRVAVTRVTPAGPAG